ncbi:MAG TPA: adenylate/guanylate cyclase domain-containing protein [Candidatus Limnocylindrales bacterium]|nr:adenylate/guanylate cyclase domain-containing protein [Candidatus Limnocylindrales bacterium]
MSVESPTRGCPRCEAAVAADARFCASCGQALGEPTTTDAAIHTRLAAAAPTPLVAKMRSARLTGERKPVTALFADVVGSTTLAEQIDPEDWTALINEAFDLMSRAVFRYEGTIAQLQGDAMVAFFGAPVAHEDDPDRAVRAALDMVAAIDEFARQLRASHGIEFRIRAGINSGPVVVGNVGTDLRYEYTALGDAMNVAARMQAAAEPGSIVITASTHRLVADAFDTEDLGEIEVKGKTERVHAFRVTGVRAEPLRRRGLERAGLESPMIGRDGPLGTLRDLHAAVRPGAGRVALVIGEPGIGKSRLLAELRHGVGDAVWLEGRSVSYGRGLPYHLLLDLVRNTLGIPFAGPEVEARAILDRRLDEILGDEAADTATWVAHLLGLPLRPDEHDRAQIDPEMMQGRYLASANRLLRALSSERSVVLVCEDLHWGDPASVTLLTQLLPIAAQLPVLFVAALRSDTDAPGWKLVTTARELFGAALTEIHLEPLSASDSRDLVANLLEIESLPVSVRDAILARAEGNPFFVEEVIRMLIEKGAIERRGEQWIATEAVSAIEIPETLHGLLLARIDQLPESAKWSLRVASVIGRQFPVRVLERVLGETKE